MRSYEFINKEWIVSRKAGLVYRIAALISLTLLPLLPILILNPRGHGLRQLLFLAVLGTALTEVGMQYFLLRFDKSAAWKQIFWFCVMLVVPVGPALYCFVVYSRSDALKESCAHLPQSQDLFSGQHER